MADILTLLREHQRAVLAVLVVLVILVILYHRGMLGQKSKMCAKPKSKKLKKKTDDEEDSSDGEDDVQSLIREIENS